MCRRGFAVLLDGVADVAIVHTGEGMGEPGGARFLIGLEWAELLRVGAFRHFAEVGGGIFAAGHPILRHRKRLSEVRLRHR